MENSQPLATESFSYSWLVDRKDPSSDCFLNDLRPKLPENSTEKEQNFNFDVPITASSSALVHADEIFSDGHIRPVYVDRSKQKTSSKTSTSSVRNSSPHPSRTSFGNWRRSSKRILQKWFGFVKPLSKTMGCSRKSNRVDDLERKASEVHNSLEASPRPSTAYSVFEWNDFKKVGNSSDFFQELKRAKSWRCSPQASPNISPSSNSSYVWCDAENSIHEAILYCKRSIGTFEQGDDK